MKVVVDDKIPWILPALLELADEVVAKAGADISRADVADAQILIVRTRTRCNRQLLEGSRVRLVVTATIGYDHLDTDYLEAAGIEWANCPGCNANSVAQYIANSLLAMQQTVSLQWKDDTIGIVGVGHVGTAVWRTLAELGCRHLLLCDPPRALAGDLPPDGGVWASMAQLQAEADIITLHIPLTTDGEYPTHHLASADFFNSLSRQPVVINAARGGVVDEEALLAAMDQGRVRAAVIDTWDQEPDINRQLLQRAAIATPHIAGYSADGKATATRMTLEHICRFLNRPMTFDIQPPRISPETVGNATGSALRLALYDPRRDSQWLKEQPELFEYFRSHYPLRREQVEGTI